MKHASLALGLAAALVGGRAAAEDYADRVQVVALRLYLKDDRGRAVVSVTNNSSEVLDIEVNCTFFKGTAKVGSGSGSVSRLPPRRSDTLDIADRQSQPLDAVHCDVGRAEK
jgi:hypothetical protein